jgi:hypothetical protein
VSFHSSVQYEKGETFMRQMVRQGSNRIPIFRYVSHPIFCNLVLKHCTHRLALSSLYKGCRHYQKRSRPFRSQSSTAARSKKKKTAKSPNASLVQGGFLLCIKSNAHYLTWSLWLLTSTYYCPQHPPVHQTKVLLWWPGIPNSAIWKKDGPSPMKRISFSCALIFS